MLARRPPSLLLLPLFVYLLWCLISQCTYGGGELEASRIEAAQLLRDFAESYRQKAPDSLSLVVQFDIGQAPESWHVLVEPGPIVLLRDGPSDRAAFVFSMNEETLRRIYDGRMTALTAGGKASGADSAPLEFEPTEAAAEVPDVREVILSFIQHFFNRSVPERVLLGEEYSRVVHGANVIVLNYNPGFRSAWYMVKRGQRLNEPGDTNPFPQAFVIISGAGFAKIGPDTVRVRVGESYYIPPHSDHVVWTADDEPVVMIWMAWGEGA